MFAVPLVDLEVVDHVDVIAELAGALALAEGNPVANNRIHTQCQLEMFALVADDVVDEALLDELRNVEFVAVQASYEGPLTERADIVFPATTWAEKSGTFTNTEGRVQAVRAALKPLTTAADDQQVLKGLAERLA